MSTDDLVISFQGDPVRVTIVGNVDLVTREQFKAALTQTFGDRGDVHLDLQGVTFMDTRSVTHVVHTAKRLHDEGGRLVVHNPPDSLRRIFETMWEGSQGDWLYITAQGG